MQMQDFSNNIQLYNGDCLKVMSKIPDHCVDLILCDLPYGTTACAWDVIIPFDKLWEQYERISKRNAVKCLFGSEPFSSHLRLSNEMEFQYDWIWNKVNSGNFQNCKKTPLKIHENISIFYKQLVNFPNSTFGDIILENMKRLNLTREDLVDLFPSKNGNRTGWLSNKIKGTQIPTKEQWDTLCEVFGIKNEYDKIVRQTTNLYNQNLHDCNIVINNKGKGGRLNHITTKSDTYVQTNTNYNKSIITYSRETGFHPTQKPVALLEFLIKTYTNEGEVVLDNCMGSGSTGVACVNTGRNFIGIELDENYYKIAEQRINDAININKQKLF